MVCLVVGHFFLIFFLFLIFFFLMIRRPPRSTQSRSSAASDVYKRQMLGKQARIEKQEIAEHYKAEFERIHNGGDKEFIGYL